jgi:hypothetical protein
LERVDPFNARLRRYEIPGQCCNGSLRLFSTDGYEWISGVGEGSRFDTRTARVQALSVPAFASGYPELVADAASSPPTAWAIDEQASTLMQLDVASGLTSAPIGLQGHPRQAVFAFGAIWVAAGAVVDRIGDLTTPQPTTTTIAMPTGVSAGSIAADPATSSVWVGNTLPPTAATQPSAP